MKFSKFIAIFSLWIILYTLSGCRSAFVSNPAKKAEKKQKKENEKFKKSYNDAVTAHYKMQSKETRKRMKKNLKKVQAQSKKTKPAKGWDCR